MIGPEVLAARGANPPAASIARSPAPSGLQRVVRRLPGLLAGTISLIALLFLGLPVLTLVVRSISEGLLGESVTSPVIQHALYLSLLTTTISLLLTVAFGLPLAFTLARRRVPFRWLANVAVDLPIVLPPSVAGLALLLLLGRRGVLGSWLSDQGVDLAFTTVAVIIAQTFVSAPFFIRSARVGFANVPRAVEDASRVDGASEWQVMLRVTLPLASVAMRAGLVLAWARALGEFGATIMFAGNVERLTQTLPLVVYSEFQASLEASIAAAAVLVIAAFGVLVATQLFSRDRLDLDADF